jgi:hypothetical protein
MKKIAGWVLYLIGFIAFVIFLTLAKKLGITAWLYAIGASVGVAIFLIGILIKDI